MTTLYEVLDSGGNGPRCPDNLANQKAMTGSEFEVADVCALPDTFLVGASIGVTTSDGNWAFSVWGRILMDESPVSRSTITSH